MSGDFIVESAGIIWAPRCLPQIERLSQAAPRERRYDDGP